MSNETKMYRVVLKQRDTYKISFGKEIKDAKLKGDFFRRAKNKSDFPHVGDWVKGTTNDNLFIIEELVPRRTQISRKASGANTEEQVLAANVDYVVVVLGLDRKRNYSDRLLERYMVLAWDSGAIPLVVLNKADLNGEAEIIQYQLEGAAPGVDIILSSTKDNYGISELYNYLESGKVAAFVGPSGVGKSSISNILLKNEVQKIGELRPKDQRGRHTTSSAQMLELENGGFIIDSPGLREIQLWADEDSLDNVFDEISINAGECRFKDCTHTGEPDCAVQERLGDGYISSERYDSYLNLKRELDFLERRKNEKAWSNERYHGKKFSKMVKREVSKKRDYNSTLCHTGV